MIIPAHATFITNGKFDNGGFSFKILIEIIIFIEDRKKHSVPIKLKYEKNAIWMSLWLCKLCAVISFISI